MSETQTRTWRSIVSTRLQSVVARLPGGRGLAARLRHSDERRRQIERRRLNDLARYRARLARLMRRLLVARAERWDPRILEQTLPARHEALLATDARERHQRADDFAARSDSYAQARRSNEVPGDTSALRLGSLTLIAPRSTASPSESFLRKGRLPLREILATRELAVGHTMIDIGANVGATSIPRVILGDVGLVYAAEPDPVNYACLVRNITANGLDGLVLPDRVALGDTNDEAMLLRVSSGTHHLVTAPSAVSSAAAVAVATATLDRWVETLGIDLARVSFVKCDTQGWEIRILLGAGTVLRQRHIAWQIEFSPQMLRRAGYDRAAACDVLRAHFTHFIDLRVTTAERVRGTAALADALAYLDTGHRRYTNLLLYNARGV